MSGRSDASALPLVQGAQRGHRGELGADIELVEDRAHLGAHGRLREPVPRCDRADDDAASQQVEHAALPGREALDAAAEIRVPDLGGAPGLDVLIRHVGALHRLARERPDQLLELLRAR